MSQIPPGLDNIPHPPLQLLGLGEAAIRLPIPQHLGRDGDLAALSGAARCLVVDGHDEGSARGGLQGDFAEGCGKG